MSQLLPRRAAAYRQASNRCWPALASPAASLTYLREISEHRAVVKLVKPKVVYPNWYMNGATETSRNTVASIKVSLEYPVGTYTLANECKAAGNAAIPMPVGNNEFTFDVDVPQGATFFMRAWVNNPAGVHWTQVAGGVLSNYGNPPGDRCDVSSSPLSDHTMGGAVQAAGGIGFYPVVIATEHRFAVPIIFGTSREAGGQYINDASNDMGISAVICGKVNGYTNFAIAATLIANWNAGSHTYLNELIAKGYWTHAINEYGINDVSDTAIALAARRATFAANLKAQLADLIVIGETLYPRTSSSDLWATKSGQTIATQPIAEFNNLVRKGISGENYCWDASDGLDPYREGKYPVTRNPNDPSYTPTLFTAGLSGTTLTVSAIASGPPLGVGVPVFRTGGVTSMWIVRQLTGTAGGIGTYEVNRIHDGQSNNPGPVAAGTSFTTAGYTTKDGLHVEWFGAEMIIINKGSALLDLLNA